MTSKGMLVTLSALKPVLLALLGFCVLAGFCKQIWAHPASQGQPSLVLSSSHSLFSCISLSRAYIVLLSTVTCTTLSFQTCHTTKIQTFLLNDTSCFQKSKYDAVCMQILYFTQLVYKLQLNSQCMNVKQTIMF